MNKAKSGVLVLPLMAPLLLSACVSQSTYDALQAKSNAQAAQIRRLIGAIRYTVNSDLLFASGSWQLRPEGKDIIAKFAAKLAPTQLNPLVVNGYTDNAPIGAALAAQGVTTNQILSQKRAESVVAFLVSQDISPSMVSASGHGEADPAASNSTAQGRAENRRVELTLAGS